MSDKKKEQLGMNPSTAQHRLLKDILWDYILKCEDNLCFHCGEEMTREDFSVEHKIPWLDSENPIDLFFDVDNIAFSHLRCNIKASRPRGITRLNCGETITTYLRGCRCEKCTKINTEFRRKQRSLGKR